MNAHISPTDLHVLDAEPRVQDLRLAEALEFSQPIDIRKLVRRNANELSTYGEVFATVAKTTPNGGRPGEEFWLNEPQSILICMFSRTDKAAQVRAEIVRVFMEWRRGRRAGGISAEQLLEFPHEDGPLSIHLAKLATLRECRMIHGARAAARLWVKLGLPQVIDSVVAAVDDGQACLAHLLGAVAIFDPDFGRHRAVRDMIASALEDALDIEQALRERFGVRVIKGREEGFLVVNNAGTMKPIFAGSPWADGRHVASLRKLPGTHPAKANFPIGQQRGTFVPADYLDRMEPPTGTEIVKA